MIRLTPSLDRTHPRHPANGSSGGIIAETAVGSAPLPFRLDLSRIGFQVVSSHFESSLSGLLFK